MTNFVVGDFYTRKIIWSSFFPNVNFPSGGPWATGYVKNDKFLIAFANIKTPGRTGHDFPNEFDEMSNKMTWFGKPNSHSEQPTFKALFQGQITLLMFARWNNKSPLFTFLGQPKIDKYENDFQLENGTKSIKISLNFDSSPTKAAEKSEDFVLIDGTKKFGRSSWFERNPRLRAECIQHFGYICKICNFDFKKTYGELGLNFCHIHHIQPLSELQQPSEVNPITDLIPVCPNCHAMLHRKVPAIKPDELKALIQNQFKP